MVDLDEMQVEVREVLPASPEQVWALLTDLPRMAGLGPENLRAEWLDDGPRLGAAFRGYNERQGFRWELPGRVVEFEPPRRFGWVVEADGEPSSWWSYALEPAEGGAGTLVTQRFRHGPGFSYLRLVVERHPERAEQYVADRAAELEHNMRSTLRAASGLLVGT